MAQDGRARGRWLSVLLELIRINERVALGLTVAQWVSVGIVIAGSVLLFWKQVKPRAAG